VCSAMSTASALKKLLAQGGGMEAVQRLLRDQGSGVIECILVTRELIGAGPGSLVRAKEIVLTSDARTTELKEHQRLFENIDEP
jgi:hypothetical protein